MTQLMRNNAKSHHVRSNQLSVEIRRNENAMAKELITIKKDCHCVAYGLVKGHEGNLDNQPRLKFIDRC